MNKKKTILILIFSIIFFIISSFIFIFLYKEIEIKNNIGEQKIIEFKKEEQRRNEIKLLNSGIKAIENEVSLLNGYFTKSTEVVHFLDKIEALARDTKAETEVTSVTMASDFSSLSVKMKATGSFEALYKFLLLLENSSYELEFNSVDISRPELIDADTGILESSEWSMTLEINLISFIK